MEEKKSLTCKGFGCACSHKPLLCWLAGLVVLIIVFCVGVKFGEWKTYFYSYGQDYYGFQPGTMMRWGNQGYGGNGMMRGWRYYDNTVAPTATTESAPTTTTGK